MRIVQKSLSSINFMVEQISSGKTVTLIKLENSE